MHCCYARWVVFSTIAKSTPMYYDLYLHYLHSDSNRVGQSREIYSNSVPLSPPHWPYPKRIRPPCWPRVAVASSIQNTKLFTWRTWPGAGAVPKYDWAARSQCGFNSGAPITQSTFDMLRRMANPLSLRNWWLHEYDNEDDYALFQV